MLSVKEKYLAKGWLGRSLGWVAKGGLGVLATAGVVSAGAYPGGYQSPGAVDVYDVMETDIQLESVSKRQVQRAPQPGYYQNTQEVQATPLVNSKAQSLRRAREEMEVETEQKIVEKLEESRIRDEQRRSERIFGNKLDRLQEEPTPKPEPEVVYIEKPAPQPASAPIVMEQEIISDEVQMSQSVQIDEPLMAPTRAYISADLGTSEYPDILNIQGKVATGVGVGVELPNRFVVEGRFRYSSYDLEKVGWDGSSQGFRDVKQYNFGAGLNYKLLESTFTPKVGTSLSYVYRTISEDVGPIVRDNTHSTGVDLGFLAGLDMDINEGFAMALDFNYFTNLSTRREGESLVEPTSKSHMEDFDYYMITLSGKFFF